MAREGFRPEFFEELARLESGNFWFRSRNALIVGLLRRHFPHLTSFLEIGCGTGYVLAGIAAAFPSSRLVGSDAFEAALVLAKRRLPDAELVPMDARSMAYDGEFAAAGAFDVLEHIVEDEEVLRQLSRAIAPGGGLILSVPQHPWFWSHQDDLVCHVRRYSARELRRKVERAGFDVLDTISFVSLLFPALWLSRRLLRRGHGRDDAFVDLRVGGVLNRVAGVVMAAERFLINAGVRFPVGGSLLLVARKK